MNSTHLSWIDNGILYHEYQNELTLTRVLEAEKESLALLSKHNLQIVPMIVLLRDLDKTQFKLTFADYGRVLCTFDIARHTAGIWIIGVPEEVKATIVTINKYFLIHQIFFAENLKEAQEAAHQVQFSTKSILDRE